MLTVLRNTLYMYDLSCYLLDLFFILCLLCRYGGILEMGPREYTLDDFYALSLDRLDRFTCLKPCGIALPQDGDILESSSDEDDDDDDDDDTGSEYSEVDDHDEETTVGVEREGGEAVEVESGKRKIKRKNEAMMIVKDPEPGEERDPEEEEVRLHYLLYSLQVSANIDLCNRRTSVLKHAHFLVLTPQHLQYILLKTFLAHHFRFVVPFPN